VGAGIIGPVMPPIMDIIIDMQRVLTFLYTFSHGHV